LLQLLGIFGEDFDRGSAHKSSPPMRAFFLTEKAAMNFAIYLA